MAKRARLLTVEEVLNELELEVEVDHEDFDEPMMPGSDDEFEDDDDSDNDENSAESDPLSPAQHLLKMRPVIDHLAEKFTSLYEPHKEVSVDEAMIKFTGRSSIKQYMPMKPIKRGIKVYTHKVSHMHMHARTHRQAYLCTHKYIIIIMLYISTIIIIYINNTGVGTKEIATMAFPSNSKYTLEKWAVERSSLDRG